MKEKYDNIDEYIADLQKETQTTEKCASQHYNLGLAYLSKRDFVAAEEEFLKAVRQSPHLAEAYIQLGGICMERGDLEGCLRYNEEAANCRPKFAIPQSNIAFVHIQRGEPDKALKALHKALKWSPNLVQARNGLAIAHYMQGNYTESEQACRTILADQPEFGPAWQNLSLALLGQNRREEAIEACQKALDLGCDVPQPLLQDLGLNP